MFIYFYVFTILSTPFNLELSNVARNYPKRFFIFLLTKKLLFFFYLSLSFVCKWKRNEGRIQCGRNVIICLCLFLMVRLSDCMHGRYGNITAMTLRNNLPNNVVILKAFLINKEIIVDSISFSHIFVIFLWKLEKLFWKR